MIGLLPLLRFGWRRNTPTRPQTVAEPPAAAPAPVEPAWDHRPPEPPTRAETCGHCGEPIPESSVDGEFCKPACAASWLTAQADVITKFIGPCPASATLPAPESEPPWLARITAWEKAKAANLVAERKAPSAGEAA